jgi:hypothetical protein
MRPYTLNNRKTTIAHPNVMPRWLVATGIPGMRAIRLQKNTNTAAVPTMGKYFFARSAPITLFARS